MALEAIVLVAGAAIFVILLYVALTYNHLMSLRTSADRSWAQIDVFLKRRHDLIPGLVDTVKGYAKYERDALETITKARAGLISGEVKERGNAAAETSRAMKSLFAVAEAYPDLKADRSFTRLQEELIATEDSISYVRIGYNDAALQFNIALQTFPSGIIANIFGFRQKDFFQAKESEREPIKIDSGK